MGRRILLQSNKYIR